MLFGSLSLALYVNASIHHAAVVMLPSSAVEVDHNPGEITVGYMIHKIIGRERKVEMGRVVMLQIMGT